MPVQLDVKTHGNPDLGVATVEAIARRLAARGAAERAEILSFHAAACARAARLGLHARLIAWADYAPGALVAWTRDAGVSGVCIEHFLLHPALVDTLRGGLSITTGTVNDAITTDRPAGLRADVAAQVPARSTATIRG